MSGTTFGYDALQDRVWLMYASEQPRVWITRHIAQGILSSLTPLVEQTAIGFGNTPAQRVQLEHKLAVTETPEGKQRYPFEVRHETREQRERHDDEYVLCKMLKAHVSPNGGKITLVTEESEVRFEFNRANLHLWLRAFRMILTEANWNLPQQLPTWLEEPLLPPSIQSLLDKPPL
jgi:hypothetical protein